MTEYMERIITKMEESEKYGGMSLDMKLEESRRIAGAAADAEEWHIRRIRESFQCTESLLARISPAMPGRPLLL